MSSSRDDDRSALLQSDDGTEIVPDGAADLFSRWLAEHGARYDKIDWPSRATVGGARGTVANRDIESGEVMLEVPAKLMISPPLCRESPELAHVYADNAGLFGTESDKVLVLFIMFERAKGERSFWFPYFNVSRSALFLRRSCVRLESVRATRRPRSVGCSRCN